MIGKNYFLAKSGKDVNGKYKTETIEEHTNRLLALFDDFQKLYKDRFSEKEIDLIKIACEIHDLGKMNSRFQKKLYKACKRESEFQKDKELDELYKKLNIDEIPHGVLSAAFLDIPKLKEKFENDYIEVLSSAIYNHHDRKIVDKSGRQIEDCSVKEIVDKDLFKYSKLYEDNMKCDHRGIKKNSVKENIYNDYEFWKKFIVIKGMLNKLDYAASAHAKHIEEKPLDASKYVSDKFIAKNWKLNDCQKFLKDNRDKNIVVVASTGIGKTEASLLWAGESKTFYTLPIKVSINAIYKRIIDDNYYDKDKVSFLHSDTIAELMKDEEYIKDDGGTIFDDVMFRYRQAKMLVYPLTVCTVDQLFYFVFKSLGTEIFPATLKYSKIIIDEIQSYTPEITAFILYGLKVITDLGGKFCIMTATLPPIITALMKEKNITFEKQKNAFLKKDSNDKLINRHFIKFIEYFENIDFDYDEVLEKAKDKKVLIICNTVKRSQEVYKKIKDTSKNTDVNLLHSRFIFKDRKDREDKILKFASNDKQKRNDDAGIWISTQIVEASLDIDFDVLYTDMATADSLLQRMGRCYRNREYNKNEPNIFIYDTHIGVSGNNKSVYDKEIYDYSAEFIKEYNSKIFTEEDKQNYINKVYDTERLEKTKYKKSIIDNYENLEKLSPASIDKSKAQDLFRDIDSITVMPSKIYLDIKEKENNIIEKYFIAKDSGDFEKMNELRIEILDHTTSVRFYMNSKFNSGLEPVKLGSKKFDVIYILDMEYDKDIGLIDKNSRIFLCD